MEELVRGVSRAVDRSDGAALARALSVLGKAPSRSAVDVAGSTEEGALDRLVSQRVGEAWGGIVAKQLLARAALGKGDIDQAYKHLVASYNLLINAMRDESGWIVPVLRVLTYEARVVAERADAQRARWTKRQRESGQEAEGQQSDVIAATAASSRNDTLRDVEKTLKKGFSACWNDRAPPTSELSKKRATLYVVAQLLKIYFKLNLLKLAQPLLRPLESTAGKSGALDRRGAFPQGDVVAYRFFVGRLRMFEDQYDEAEKHLVYAFDHCDKRRPRNKRAILEFLLPVRLRRGTLPKRALLAKYGLLETLGPLVDAVKAGDLRTFNDELAKHQMAFVKSGTFLLLEKVKILVYRNLFKKIYLVNDKSPQIKLTLFERALSWLGMPMDFDEIECILANLIFKGLIKGYISHQKQTLVLSKKAPFPTEATSKL